MKKDNGVLIGGVVAVGAIALLLGGKRNVERVHYVPYAVPTPEKRSGKVAKGGTTPKRKVRVYSKPKPQRTRGGQDVIPHSVIPRSVNTSYNHYGTFSQPTPVNTDPAPMVVRAASHAQPMAAASRGERFDTVLHSQANTVAQRNEQKRLSRVQRYHEPLHNRAVANRAIRNLSREEIQEMQRAYLRRPEAVPMRAHVVDIHQPMFWAGLGGLDGLGELGELNGRWVRLVRKKKLMHSMMRRLAKKLKLSRDQAKRRQIAMKYKRQAHEYSKIQRKLKHVGSKRRELITRLTAENVLVSLTPQQYEAMKRAKTL